MVSEEKNLTVHDLSIVTYLRILGFKYTEVPEYVDGRVVFYFKNCPEVQDAIKTYLSGNATINPLVFSQVRRNLKKSIDAAVKEALSELTIKKSGRQGRKGPVDPINRSEGGGDNE